MQLTRDLVPVIYHDFSMSESGTDIPIHDLTVEQVSNKVPSEMDRIELTCLVYVRKQASVAAQWPNIRMS